MVTPLPNGTNGLRNGLGRFAPGNPGGPGNPYARRVAKLRSILLEAVSDEDLKAIVVKLVEQAKAGDLAAAREILTRTVGRPDDLRDRELVVLEEETSEAKQVGITARIETALQSLNYEERKIGARVIGLILGTIPQDQFSAIPGSDKLEARVMRIATGTETAGPTAKAIED